MLTKAYLQSSGDPWRRSYGRPVPGRKCGAMGLTAAVRSGARADRLTPRTVRDAVAVGLGVGAAVARLGPERLEERHHMCHHVATGLALGGPNGRAEVHVDLDAAWEQSAPDVPRPV